MSRRMKKGNVPIVPVPIVPIWGKKKLNIFEYLFAVLRIFK